MKRVLIALLAFVVIIGACSSGPKCSQGTYIEIVTPTIDKWDDAVELANNTSRGSLAPQISALQEIRREMASLEIPECATDAHVELTDYMDSTIDGFLAFLAVEEDIVVSRYFKEADRHFDKFMKLKFEIGQ